MAEAKAARMDVEEARDIHWAAAHSSAGADRIHDPAVAAVAVLS